MAEHVPPLPRLTPTKRDLVEGIEHLVLDPRGWNGVFEFHSRSPLRRADASTSVVAEHLPGSRC